VNALHERLLTAIDEITDGAEWGDACGPLAVALCAVVELHAPFVHPYHPEMAPYTCSHCDMNEGWPCSTIQAIAEALGIHNLDRRSE